MGESYTRTTVRAAIYTPAFPDRVLAVKHLNGYWEFPGGGVKSADDSLEETLFRELYEELGLDSSVLTLIDTDPVSYSIPVESRPYDSLDVNIFLMRLSSLEPIRVNKKELLGYGLLLPERLTYTESAQAAQDLLLHVPL